MLKQIINSKPIHRYPDIWATIVESFQSIVHVFWLVTVTACLTVLPPVAAVIVLRNMLEPGWEMAVVYGWLVVGCVCFLWVSGKLLFLLGQPLSEAVEVLVRICGLEKGVRVSADDYVPLFTTKTGTRYHRRDCISLRDSRVAVLPDDIRKNGIQPCGICRPPKY